MKGLGGPRPRSVRDDLQLMVCTSRQIDTPGAVICNVIASPSRHREQMAASSALGR